MIVKGLIENSFLDWDGKIATIIFTGGCNFLCPFCHNKDLVITPDKMESIPESYIFNYIEGNRQWIDGVVITGGEPFLEPDLLDFIRKVKLRGLLVKLDTNGYLHDRFKQVLETGLVDYVAMDIKSGLKTDRYSQVAGIHVDISKIKASIDFLQLNKIEYEFRTTIIPAFVTLDDLQNIADYLNPGTKWAWQNFRKTETLIDSDLMMIMPYLKKDIDEFQKIVTKNKELEIIRR
ncbi:MAG: anaerobic ribonucleoside-triphosphate reductase activating protein [bacterium]|nr:anaerobic ribonucleoside-triphosphate reductase activating protein [bacterium]